MNNYRIEIEENIDVITKNIIQDYWSIENEEFIFSMTKLRTKYNITQTNINKFIKNHSSCIVFEKCEECKIDFERKVETKGFFKDNSCKCEKCDDNWRKVQERMQSERIEENRKNIELKNEENRKKNEQLNNEKEEKFNLAIENKLWLNLSEYELEVLNKILQSENLKDIKRTVFKGNFYDKFVWSTVNKLDRLGLIVIERGWQNQVEAILFSSNLKNLITVPLKTNIADYLSFSLAKKDNKTTIKQPDYAGTFTLPTDVILKAGIKYIYGGWVQTDNSISLKFTPLSDIQKVNQTDIENEPITVGELIKDMFSKINTKDDEDVYPF